MVGSNIFPKVDGDVLYASEANMFSQGGVIANGSGFVTAGSSTDGIIVGSVYIPANIMSNPCTFDFIGITGIVDGANNYVYTTFSGIGGNVTISPGSQGLGGQKIWIPCAKGFFSDSSISGAIYMDRVDGATLRNTATLSLNPASGIVVLLGIKHDGSLGTGSDPKWHRAQLKANYIF